jgi:hypothetical protein
MINAMISIRMATRIKTAKIVLTRNAIGMDKKKSRAIC